MITTMRPSPRSFGAGDGIVELYQSEYRSLVRLASLLIDDVGTCEELVQDAFAKLVVSGPKLREPDRQAAYLRSIVLNGARSHLRHRQVVARHPESAPAPGRSADAAALAHDEQAAVLHALRSLPERQREVLVLRYWMELSEAEIAATLGISAGTVKTHAHRGLERLAQTLEDRR